MDRSSRPMPRATGTLADVPVFTVPCVSAPSTIESQKFRGGTHNKLPKTPTRSAATQQLPMKLRIEAMPDDPHIQAILYGPVVLAGDLEGLTPELIVGPNVLRK